MFDVAAEGGAQISAIDLGVCIGDRANKILGRGIAEGKGLHVLPDALAEIVSAEEGLEHGQHASTLAIGDTVKGRTDVFVTLNGLPDLPGARQTVIAHNA